MKNRRTFMKSAITLSALGLFGRLGSAQASLKPKEDLNPPHPGPIVGASEFEFEELDLIDRLTFDSFKVAHVNEFAHAASWGFAENIQRSSVLFPFLCIYGPTSSGKTHLLHAIGNKISKARPGFKIKYSSGDQFRTDCISCIRRGQMDKFRQYYYRTFDLVMIDDVQALARGNAVQEELRYLLDYRSNKSLPVVITASEEPDEIIDLNGFLKSRLNWGLLAEISPLT